MNGSLVRAWILATIVAIAGCEENTTPTVDKNGVAPKAESSEMLVVSDPPHASSAECKLCVRESFVFKVDKSGTAAGNVTLCNGSDDKIPLDLQLSEFREQHSHGEVHAWPADSSFKQPDGGPLPAHMEKGCKRIRIELANFAHAHATAARLSNGGDPLIDITAARYDVPFKVKIDGPTPEKASISIAQGHGRITLRNDDPSHYRFRWHLELPGAKPAEGVGDIPPKGWAEIPVEYPSNFLESGFLRSSNQSGKLTLDYEPVPYDRSSIVEPKSFDVAARISHFADTAQRLANYGFILGVLLLGILLSMLVNFVMPTERTRIDIRDQLVALEGALKSLADVVDPRLLTLLRVEKRRLREELRDLWPILPQTAVDLPALKQRVEALARRIALTVRAGNLLAVMQAGDERLSVMEARDIAKQCDVALAVAANDTPTPDDEKAAESSLQAAAALLMNADGPPNQDLVAALKVEQGRTATEIAALAPGIDAWPSAADGHESPAAIAKGMFKMLQADFASADQVPTRAQFIRAAKALANAALMRDFVRLVSTAQGEARMKRRLGRLNHLVAAIAPGRGSSLDVAKNIVREVEQDVSAAELLAALDKQFRSTPEAEKSFWLETDPPTPLPLQVVILRVRARDPGYDVAAARREIEVTWTIGGERQEGIHGWRTAAFFPEDPRWYHPIKWLRARVASAKAHVINAEFKGTPLKLDREVTIEPRKSYGASRLLFSFASLLITLLLVSLALMAGAQEKLESVDWLTGFIAVLVIGYTANTIKSAITK